MEANQQEVRIWAGNVEMEGMLDVPAAMNGVVLFAHGSGSSRHSPRNNFVARQLRERQLGTLLLDLLTPGEDRDPEARFDIRLLTERLAAARAWLGEEPATSNQRVGLFGASTGAAAALALAARDPDGIAAVVSRGGRPDMTGADALAKVTAPTLFIVGGNDEGVLELNQQAYAYLRCEKDFAIVPGATHLFEESGALENVALLATDWFVRHCRSLL